MTLEGLKTKPFPVLHLNRLNLSLPVSRNELTLSAVQGWKGVWGFITSAFFTSTKQFMIPCQRASVGGHWLFRQLHYHIKHFLQIPFHTLLRQLDVASAQFGPVLCCLHVESITKGMLYQQGIRGLVHPKMNIVLSFIHPKGTQKEERLLFPYN